MGPRRLRRSRRRFALAAILLACVVALALSEAVLRLFVPVTDVPFQFWDPVVGPRRLPNQAGNYFSGASVRARYHFNTQGWNYPDDFSFARPAGTRRVCIVGDSYVEALQVNCDKQMAVVLERLLSRPGRPVQCYPFGVSGYGTAQEYQIIRHYALDYAPDVVIVFFTSNDVYDASPYLSPIDSAYARYRLDASGELERMPMTPWAPSGLRRFAAKFALARYTLIQNRLLSPRRATGPGGVTLREASDDTREDQFPGIGMSQDERGKMSWLLVERLLSAAQSDCQARGATLVVVYRGNLPEIEAAEGGPAYQPMTKENDPYCLDQRIFEMGRDFLEPMAARLKIPYLDFTTALVDEVKSTGRPHNFSDDDHFNELGHAAAARAMAGLVEHIISGPDGERSQPPAPAESPHR
ncbi:MAG TPA: SGNH/GDSL hydrolase family protein [Phycisphaerae bacterium]|nr:SGNH/GDSL hydrolase family protein [Phycisphaerae bacterium]